MPSTVLDFEFDDTKYSQISGNFGAFGPCPGRISSHSVVFFPFPLLFSSSSSSSFFFFFFFFSALLVKNARTIGGGGLLFLLLSLFCARPTILIEEAPNKRGGDVIVVVVVILVFVALIKRRFCVSSRNKPMMIKLLCLREYETKAEKNEAKGVRM